MTFLRSIGSFLYKAWMGFAKVLAIVNTTLLLTIVYIFLIGPLWLVMKIKREDMLDRALTEDPSYWKEKESKADDRSRSRRQF